MNTASCEKEAPSLSRDEAIAILDTPDEELEALPAVYVTNIRETG